MGGVLPIPVTKIIQYASLEGVHDSYLFKKVMLDIDKQYRELINEKQKQESKSKGKKR